MVAWLALVIGALVMLFGFVILFGAPYLPTLNKQKQTALDLLDLKPGQLLVELGSGDGRMLTEAASRGIRAVGYELNPLLFAYSWLATRRHRRLIKVYLANYWSVKLPKCDGIYVFLLDRYMPKLYKKLTQEIASSTKLVSFAFKLPDIKHTTEKNGLYLYTLHNKNDKS